MVGCLKPGPLIMLHDIRLVAVACTNMGTCCGLKIWVFKMVVGRKFFRDGKSNSHLCVNFITITITLVVLTELDFT